MAVDFRKSAFPPTPIILCDSPVDTVDSLHFLEAIVYQDTKGECRKRFLVCLS